MKEIVFKNIPEKWIKEKIGLKKNIVRIIDENDDRFIELLDRLERAEKQKDIEVFHHILDKITIENIETKEKFTRNLKDITIFNNYIILSW